jgi:hypothetical protein
VAEIPTPANGWGENKHLINYQIGELKAANAELRQSLSELSKAVAKVQMALEVHKVRTGVIGSISGAVGGAVAMLAVYWGNR